MKHPHLLMAMAGIMHFSCSKTAPTDLIPESLNGKWRMILVTDGSSGRSITKPSSILQDVDLTFASAGPTNGTFSGNTPTNTIYQSEYLTEAGQTLTISYVNMTKVGETSWGNEFLENILKSRKYDFDNDRLNIKTTEKTLTFKKL